MTYREGHGEMKNSDSSKILIYSLEELHVGNYPVQHEIYLFCKVLQLLGTRSSNITSITSDVSLSQ